MPPKGGFFNLSDAEVEAAVAYVVDRSQTIVTALKEKKSKTSCHPIKNPNACSDKELEDIITLHMLWLLGSPGGVMQSESKQFLIFMVTPTSRLSLTDTADMKSCGCR
jgi:hypothetical protein